MCSLTGGLLNVSGIWQCFGEKYGYFVKEKIKRLAFLSPLLVRTSGTCRKMLFISLTSFVFFTKTLAFSLLLIQRKSLLICKYCICISQVGNACSAGEVSTSQKGLFPILERKQASRSQKRQTEVKDMLCKRIILPGGDSGG